MHTVKLSKNTYQIPSKWSELDFPIHLKLAFLLLSGNVAGLPYAILAYIMGDKKLKKLPDSHLQPLLELVNWAKETPYSPDPSQLETPLFKLAPSRISLMQLAIAHFYLRHLSNEKLFEKALNEITFSLLLFNGQKEYSEDEKEANQATHSSTISMAHKILIALWFATWHKTSIVDRYSPKHDEPEVDWHTGQPVEEKANADQYGYFPLIVQVAQSGIYGTYEQAAKVPAHTVFFNAMICK